MTETFTIALATAAGETIVEAGVEVDDADVSPAEVQATADEYGIPGESAEVDQQQTGFIAGGISCPETRIHGCAIVRKRQTRHSKPSRGTYRTCPATPS